MSAIVECVPNFSEGSNTQTISAITAAIEQVQGISLLDVDPGASANRTVVTFVGPPKAVVEAAFQAIRTAQLHIDMRSHQGEHPRMGATDVCPLVPVSGISLEECAALATALAERVSSELGIPTFLYEAAATSPKRSRLPDLRKGEYEALKSKLTSADWGPDFGPREWNETVAKAGGTVIGARPFLIAWNVNLNTTNQRIAEKLAGTLREKGKYARAEDGQLLRGSDGKPYRSPGRFRAVNAIGWTIPEYNRCQLSCNMLDFTVTGLHTMYDAVRELALESGAVVTGSELVGLIPKQALLDAGHHYLQIAGENPGRCESEVIDVAIRSLGLNDLSIFDADQAIIERRMASDGPLVKRTNRAFSDLLASDAPAPGGGSVAALCGGLSVALSAMVAQLSTKISAKTWPYATPRPESWQSFDALAMRAQQLREDFLHDVDADTAAFDAMMAARKLPKHTEAEKRARLKAVRAALIQAIETPLGVLRRTQTALDCAELAMTGNPNARSDAGVAVSAARACAEGAWMNVQINLQGMRDQELRQDYCSEADQLLDTIHQRCNRLWAKLRAELHSSTT